MKKLKLFFAISLVLSLIISLALSFMPVAAGQGREQASSSQRILVKFKDGTTESTKQNVEQKHGDSGGEDIAPLGVRVITVPQGKAADRLSAYRSDSAVAFAEPDYVATAYGVPNDPYFSYQWGLTKIQAPQAWDITTGQPGVKIAILDTGVDQNNVDLASKIVANQNFTTSATVDDLYGHGTHVAGIAAAITNNGVGIAGTGYNSSIMNVKVLDDTGSGYYSWISSGITWAADNGAKVISMSLGGSSPSTTMESAINYAWSKGAVVVAAAGNSGSTALSYPAAYTNVISVAATDQNDAKASFSSYGSWVDVAAPGVNIFSTLPNHSNQIGAMNYGYLSGTSMATPFVSGLAALVWSTPYGTDNAGVRNRIQNTADHVAGTGSYWQYGRINAYSAVLGATPTPPSLAVAVSAPVLTNQRTFTVQATVTNSGSTTATAAAASIALPAGLTTADTLTKSLGDIAGGSSATASWSVTAAADGPYSISMSASATNATLVSASTTVTVDTTPPARVTGVTVTPVSSSQLNLTWNANTEPDLRNYDVYRSSVTGGPYIMVASPATNSYSNSGLSPSTTYYYVVSALDAAGNEGPKSAEVSGTTSAAPVNSMHVQSIAMSLRYNGSYVRGQAVGTIVDASGRPVSGVAVYGHWSGATTGTASGVTNSRGTVTFRSSYYRRPPSGTTFTFTVDNAILSGWTYNPGANVITSNSITVP